MLADMLFAESKIVGTFKGFNERGLEFSADIVTPYDAGMLERPQLGQFILIELGSQEEASLGRITRFVPSGLLATAEGEDYINTMQRRQQDVPEDLKQQRLKYRVNVKLLGAVRTNPEREKEFIYVPSQRRLPHLGARVALPSDQVLQKLCKLSGGDTHLGSYVLGEFVFCGSASEQKQPELISFDPELNVTFDISNLVSKRSVVFARAGYGKSNLVKYLVAELYKKQPEPPSGRPVGTLIFDPDGEYFWPDSVANRPGLCDVPELAKQLLVYTNRQAPNAYYNSWKAGSVKLDVRDLSPRDVISIAVSSDRQDQQNVLKLKSVRHDNWRTLVDLIHEKGLQADDEEIGSLLGYGENQIAQSGGEIAAARSNMTNVVRTLHDPDSKVLSGALSALAMGKIVVVDISLLSSGAGNVLAGLILRRIFSHNQENFTGSGQSIIPVVAIIEEAQSVLGRRLEDTSPFVEWVKEGRKYDLGAMLVTQQPGAMAPELLSQADNWFCFHLLSEGDAGVLGKYNSHYSSDVLAHLIAEPIPGNCYMWSAPCQPFVLPVRIADFGALYQEKIKKDESAVAVDGTGANETSKAVEETLSRLAKNLRSVLARGAVVYRRVPLEIDGKSVDLGGILSGQLFYLIQKVLKSSGEGVPRSEDELKQPLLATLLGEDNLHIVRHQGKEYYCATIECWKKVIGERKIELKETS